MGSVFFGGEGWYNSHSKIHMSAISVLFISFFQAVGGTTKFLKQQISSEKKCLVVFLGGD